MRIRTINGLFSGYFGPASGDREMGTLVQRPGKRLASIVTISKPQHAKPFACQSQDTDHSYVSTDLSVNSLDPSVCGASFVRFFISFFMGDSADL